MDLNELREGRVDLFRIKVAVTISSFVLDPCTHTSIHNRSITDNNGHATLSWRLSYLDDGFDADPKSHHGMDTSEVNLLIGLKSKSSVQLECALRSWILY